MNDHSVSKFVADRATEPSTWAGILTAIGGIYVAVTVGDMAGVGAGVVAVFSGLMNIFGNRKKK